MALPDAAAADFLDDYPDVDDRSCQLLGPTALVVQGLLGVLVILSLVYKRHRETPKRPWRIWLFDVSKQVVGQMFVHAVNLFVSGLGSDTTEGNACVFYFLNILIDTTLGVALIYVMLHLLTYLAKEKFALEGFESGVYGSPPSMKYWARQAAIYVMALTTMKLLVVGLLALWPGIFVVGEWILSWTYTTDGDAVQVIFTMGLFPIIMNIVQFWLIDSIVKASNAISLETDSPTNLDDGEYRQPLFDSPWDNEDDEGYKPGDIENQRHGSNSHSSLDLRRDKSFSSNPDESKSVPSSGNSASHDEHSYPPSLNSSFNAGLSGNDHGKGIKPAKNLMKKPRRAPPATLSPQIQTVVEPQPQISNDQHITKAGATEWADPWVDDDEWVTHEAEEEWTGRRSEGEG